jgi:hypothetical protein
MLYNIIKGKVNKLTKEKPHEIPNHYRKQLLENVKSVNVK